MKARKLIALLITVLAALFLMLPAGVFAEEVAPQEDAVTVQEEAVIAQEEAPAVQEEMAIPQDEAVAPEEEAIVQTDPAVPVDGEVPEDLAQASEAEPQEEADVVQDETVVPEEGTAIEWDPNVPMDGEVPENMAQASEADPQVDINGYLVTTAASPLGAGYVTGAGTFQYGEPCTVTAVAAGGYVFTGWLFNGHSVPVTSNPYTFPVNGNTSVVAVFERISGNIVITTGVSPAGAGYVTGGGSYYDNSQVTLTASANPGYVFSHWEYSYNGTSISTANPYTFNAGTIGSRHIIAVFTPVSGTGTYTLTTGASPSGGGYVTGGGTYHAGSTVIVTAVPNPGYYFTGFTINGTHVSTSNPYSFVLNQNTYIVANFSTSTSGAYTVTTSASPTYGGYVTGGGRYNAGQYAELRAVPHSGYSFNGWIINGVQHINYTNPYSLRVTGNTTVVAVFVPTSGRYYVSTSTSPINGGYVYGGGYYAGGETVTLTATPRAGYAFDYWIINGHYYNTYSTYTFRVTGNMQAVAVFRAIAVTPPTQYLTVIPSTLNLEEGNTSQLTYTVYPTGSYYGSVRWSTSDSSVATVNTYGVVTARNPGQCRITATTSTGVSGSCLLTVTSSTVEIEGITLNHTEGTINIGEEFALNATIRPNNATNKNLTWTSSNSNVASIREVDNNRVVVTGVSEGSAVIRVESEDGSGESASCDITVVNPTVPVTGVQISQTSARLTTGETVDLNETVIPDNATDKGVTWNSSNAAVATVDQNGLVTAVGVGSANISVTTNDGDFTANCSVVVVAPTVPAQSISVSPATLNLTTVAGGTQSATVTATVTPADTTDQVNWASNAPNIVGVSGNGSTATVTAYAAGRATVTATAGSQRASVQIVVYDSAIVCDAVEITSGSPDEYTVTAINLRPNPAMAGMGGVQKVSFFTWSNANQSDMNAKVATRNGNNYSYTFPVNNNNVNNYYTDADSIKVNVYASTSMTSDGSLINSQTYKWVNGMNAGGRGVAYIGYVQNIGFDKPTVYDGAEAGTTGQALHMEGLRVSSNIPGLSVMTTVFAQGLGWMDQVGDGTYAGTMGQNRPIEMLTLSLQGSNASNYSIRYRVHQSDVGWSDWRQDGAIAGEVYQSHNIEAVEISIVPR